MRRELSYLSVPSRMFIFMYCTRSRINVRTAACLASVCFLDVKMGLQKKKEGWKGMKQLRTKGGLTGIC